MPPIHIVIANLPSGVTPEEVKTRFEKRGLNGAISLLRDGDPGKVTAIIETKNMNRIMAIQIAYRIDGMFFRGRHLQSYVPLFL